MCHPRIAGPGDRIAQRAASWVEVTAVALGLTSAVLPLVASAQATCEPVAARAGQTFGCFITAHVPLGPLPRDTALFWAIDSVPSGVNPALGPSARASLVTSLDRRWVFSIVSKGADRPTATRVATIGPLPLVAADSFVAVYMEGVFQPGMETRVHRHPGVEAWYTLEGEQCLETPAGKLVQRAGDPGVFVPGGPPMRLTGTGVGVRRSLVLILHDATKPRQTIAEDWVPKGLCHQR